MKELSIEEIRSIQLDILLYIDQFCSENNIQYFLSNGSALGAVKYGGFIPWDDDIDICMLRPDYDRFVSEYPSDSKYRLFSRNVQKDFAFPFAKVSDRYTIIHEHNVDNGVDFGVNIDVFPLDGFGLSVNETHRIYRKAERYRKKLLFSKTIKPMSTSKIKNAVLYVIIKYYKIFGSGFYCDKIEKLCRKRTLVDPFIGNVAWGFYNQGEAHKASVFSIAKRKKFEDGEYPVPGEYDAYLRKLYGNYHLDPPKDKQCTHHNYLVYRR